MARTLDAVIDDPNLSWTVSSFGSEEDFTYRLSKEVLSELQQVRLPGSYREIPFRREDFPYLGRAMSEFYTNFLDRGIGIGLIRGLTPENFSREQQDMVYWMICDLLGEPLKQNIHGEIRVEVKDEGKKMETGGRYHQTSQGGSLHTDSPQWLNVPDYLGLLCLHSAKEGGESKLVSAYSVHNEMLRDHPELLKLLYEPFHFDKRGEFKEGESPTTLAPIFSYNSRDLRFRYLRDYVVQGHDRVGEPLSQRQLEALGKLDVLLEDESLVVTMGLRAGDINFVNNHRVIHGRTGFVDYAEPERKRVMVRAWLRDRNGQ